MIAQPEMQHEDIDPRRRIRPCQLLRGEHDIFARQQTLVEDRREIRLWRPAELRHEAIAHEDAEPKSFDARRVGSFEIFDDRECPGLFGKELAPAT